MDSYVCACCAADIGDFLPDDWDGCSRCGCGTAERIRRRLIDPRAVAAQLVADATTNLKDLDRG
ncbi:MAG TPA: hypothetical protein VGK41_01310 [Solirubrobacterales bacterium]